MGKYYDKLMARARRYAKIYARTYGKSMYRKSDCRSRKSENKS